MIHERGPQRGSTPEGLSVISVAPASLALSQGARTPLRLLHGMVRVSAVVTKTAAPPRSSVKESRAALEGSAAAMASPVGGAADTEVPHDMDLEASNPDEPEPTPKERNLFSSGKLHLAEAVQMWRRVLVRFLLRKGCRTFMMSYVTLSVNKKKLKSYATVDPDICLHPVDKQKPGGNGAGRYTTCRDCGVTLMFRRWEEIPQAETGEQPAPLDVSTKKKNMTKDKKGTSSDPSKDTPNKVPTASSTSSTLEAKVAKSLEIMVKQREKQTELMLGVMNQQAASQTALLNLLEKKLHQPSGVVSHGEVWRWQESAQD